MTRMLPLMVLVALLGACGPKDVDGDGVSEELDCDDSDASVFPGALDVCDGKDNDCDGDVDENPPADNVFYVDGDGDGFGGAGDEVTGCEVPDGYASMPGDCDDTDPAIHPGAPELCDGVDQDCDTAVDEDAVDAVVLYRDADGDGFGNLDGLERVCPGDATDGYVDDFSDCDDLDWSVYPGSVERCDAIDNDCNGIVDDDYAVDAPAFHVDLDGDGYGDPAATARMCTAHAGFTTDATDCDDTSSATYLGAAIEELELCARDLDGDGYGDANVPPGVDAGSDCLDSDDTVYPGAAASEPDVCGYDGDGDGYATSTPADARIEPGGDCDDTTGGVYPGWTYDGPEICGHDADGDGWADTDAPAGYDPGLDCDNANAAINPDATEICFDGIDQDCDGGAGPCGLDGMSTVDSAYAYGYGENSYDYLGKYGTLADLDGDGSDEVIMGAYNYDAGYYTSDGIVYGIYSPSEGADMVAGASFTMVGEADSSVSSGFITAGDFDGDGREDLLLGTGSTNSYDVNGAYVVYSSATPFSGAIDLGAYAHITTSQRGNVSSVGDLDGDGYDDFVIGDYYSSDLAYLFYGGSTQLLSGDAATLADATFEGGDYNGWQARGGDLDGDGYGDLLVSAYSSEELHLFLGGSSRFAGTYSTEDVHLTGGSDSSANTGYGFDVGDVDGDGYDDAVIGAYGDEHVYMLFGYAGMTGEVDLDTAADWSAHGKDSGDYFGHQVALGDYNADGDLDIAIGEYGWDGDVYSGTSTSGAVWIYMTPVTAGSWQYDDADGFIEGAGATSSDGAYFSYSLSAGNINGDAYDDLAGGGYYHDGGASSGGAYWVFRGGEM